MWQPPQIGQPLQSGGYFPDSLDLLRRIKESEFLLSQRETALKRTVELDLLFLVNEDQFRFVQYSVVNFKLRTISTGYVKMLEKI